MRSGMLNDCVMFQKIRDGVWEDFYYCHAYINGVSGNEFFLANAGDSASLTVTVTIRYRKALMCITPMQYRLLCDGVVYELISPADDVKGMHKEIKFRAKRLYSERDGEMLDNS